MSIFAIDYNLTNKINNTEHEFDTFAEEDCAIRETIQVAGGGNIDSHSFWFAHSTGECCCAGQDCGCHQCAGGA